MLHLLSYDSSMRAIVSHHALEVIKDINSNNYILKGETLRNDERHIGNFIFDCGGEAEGLEFIKYLRNKIEEIHTNDIEPEPTSTVEPYNPAKTGRFYYFTPTGNKLRNSRAFVKDTQGKPKAMHDDPPEMSRCRKMYGVGKPGSTYLFAFFCTMHGHCYGAHIIPGNEGRKDAYHAMYQHMEEAPKNVFYDFACSLGEEVMNRESGFFRKTKFYHDIFHGYSHTCSSAYKVKANEKSREHNTSICEQFNSFLKKTIKNSARNMTQEHFMFLVQFLVHEWNKRKKAPYEEKHAIFKE